MTQVSVMDLECVVIPGLGFCMSLFLLQPREPVPASHRNRRTRSRVRVAIAQSGRVMVQNQTKLS